MVSLHTFFYYFSLNYLLLDLHNTTLIEIDLHYLDFIGGLRLKS